MARANVLISAAGWLLGFTEKLVMALKKRGVTDEAIHQLVTGKGDAAVEKIADELAKMMTGAVPDSDLLSSIGTINTAATGKFFASDHFTTGIKAVKIVYIGDDFRQWFSSKVEEPQTEALLRIRKLKKSSLDAPILAELGDKAETTLACIWELLKKQPRGESGTLLTNGYANIFYVRDATGALRAVCVVWSVGGWDVYARSVAHPGEWSDGRQVFSRSPR